MSYAKDWTYIYINHTKLIKKQQKTLKLEMQSIIFLKYNLLTPLNE